MSSSLFFFFFNDTATTEIYTLSLHDALPILHGALQRIPFDRLAQDRRVQVTEIEPRGVHGQRQCAHAPELGRADAGVDGVQRRSELVDVRQRETPRRARR